MELIAKDALVAKIKARIGNIEVSQKAGMLKKRDADKKMSLFKSVISLVDTLEVKEVDLDKLGEIARHLIAVKENIEDMRLDSSEWNLLKRIGYPENFKAQKGE